MKLNLGCGEDIKEGFTNVDIIERQGVDKIDLNKYPLPFEDNSVNYIYSKELLEHLDNPIEFLKELHRICKPFAIIDLYLPHYSLGMNYADLTHRRFGFSYLTFGHPAWNNDLNAIFITLKKKLIFTDENYKFLNYIFNPLINLFPVFYERFLCYMLPCSLVYFMLEVEK